MSDEKVVSGDQVDFITAIKLNIDQQILFKLKDALDTIVLENTQYVNNDRKAVRIAMQQYVEKRISELASGNSLKIYIEQIEKDLENN